MLKKIRVRELTIGDWLERPIKTKIRTINPCWEGLSEEELNFIKRNLGKEREVVVKQGIPFVPAFLIAFIALILILI